MNDFFIQLTDLAPLSDLGPCDVLDGHRQAVLDPLPGVDGPKSSLSQLGPDAVGALKDLPPPLGRQDGLEVGARVGGQATHDG